MSKRFDELFGDIVAILRRDYAGAELAGDRFDPRYYNTAIGQAWHDDRLDELTFLRYVSQMLACTGDRHLRFSMGASDTYRPWSCGFFTRRYGDSLYVTGLHGETRLRPGDRILAVNGAAPGAHRARIQKNFFYSDEPEREDWNGFLKMAQTVDVEHTDGGRERLELQRFPLFTDPPRAALREVGGGCIIDLRNVPDMSDDEVMSLLPRVCREDTPLAALLDTEFYVNYTPLNCALRAAGLPDTEDAGEYRRELAEKSGKGFLPERDEDDTVVPGAAAERTAVLVDTWTGGGAEALALAARRAGAFLIGRPTLGTLDCGGDVSLALDERYTLTWPTLITRDAREGRGLMGRGVAPDAAVPWTPAECCTDRIMDAAIQWIRKGDLA